MATNKNPIFLNSINYTPISFINADGTTAKKVFTPEATDGGAVMQINVTSTDTSDVVMQVNVNNGSTSFLLGSVNVPAGSGTNGVLPSVNILDPSMITGLQNDGSLTVLGGHTVQVNPVSAVTATFSVDIVPQSGDYNV